VTFYCIPEIFSNPDSWNIYQRLRYYPVTIAGMQGRYLFPLNGTYYLCGSPEDRSFGMRLPITVWEEETVFPYRKGYGSTYPVSLAWDDSLGCWKVTFVHDFSVYSPSERRISLEFHGPSDIENPLGEYTLAGCWGNEDECANAADATATVGTPTPDDLIPDMPVGTTTCVENCIAAIYDAYEGTSTVDFYYGPEIVRPAGKTCILDIANDLFTARSDLEAYTLFNYSADVREILGLPQQLKITLLGFPDPPFSGVDGTYVVTATASYSYIYDVGNLIIKLYTIETDIIFPDNPSGITPYYFWVCRVRYFSGGTEYGVILGSADFDNYYPHNPYYTFAVRRSYPSPGDVYWHPYATIEPL